MSTSGEERKHPASERKRQLSRERGQVPKSHDLASSGSLIVALLAIRYLGGPLCHRLTSLWTDAFARGLEPSWSVADAVHRLVGVAAIATMAVLPLLLVLLCSAILVHIAQTGPLLAVPAVTPQWSRIDPLSGFRRLVSPRGWLRIVFGIGKIAAILGVVWMTLRAEGRDWLSLGSEPLPSLVLALFENLSDIALRIALVLLLLGAFDYGFQRWRHEEDLKMTDQELREELRESQGDPQLRQRRKELREPAGPAGVRSSALLRDAPV